MSYALIVTLVLGTNLAFESARAERLLSTIVCISSQATKSKRPALDPRTVVQLVDWIISKTGWTEKDLPKILFASPEQLNEMYFRKASGSNGVTVRALYERRARTVHLSNTWNPNNLRDQSYLVHELVHHLQSLNNVEVACNSAYNIQAYQLQFDWLHEQGVRDPQPFLGINDVVLFSSAQCPMFRGCDFLPEGCGD